MQKVQSKLHARRVYTRLYKPLMKPDLMSDGLAPLRSSKLLPLLFSRECRGRSVIQMAIHSFPYRVHCFVSEWVDDLHSPLANHAKVGYARICAQEAE